MYTGPNIVTDGLVLHLDAGNTKSYPGSGTTWLDKSGNGNDGTLINGPTFDSGNGGSIAFDGSNDYCDLQFTNLSNVYTVSLWANISTFQNKMIFGWNRYNIYGLYSGGAGFGFNSLASDRYGVNLETITALGLEGNWHYYSFIMYGEGSYANNKIYIDGVEQVLNSGSPTGGNYSNINFGDGSFNIAGIPISTSYRISMKCSIFTMYDRALSTQEILQNYNATKSRFGL